MDKIKIAICFSGQPRAWKKAKDQINRLISEFDSTPDIFMHVWNFNSTSTNIRTVSGNTQNRHKTVSPFEIEELIKNYRPKGVKIESLGESNQIISRAQAHINSLMPKDWDGFGTASWLSPQYYGIKKAAELKRDYEIKNNFFYDVVIRMRYDTILNEKEIFRFNFNIPDKLTPLTLYACNTKEINDIPFFITGDVLFYADSHTYDVVSDYVDYLPYVFSCTKLENIQPEKLFSTYLQSMYLNVNPLIVDPKVVRPEKYFEDLKKYKAEPYMCDIGNDLSGTV